MKFSAKFKIGTIKEYNRNTFLNRLSKICIIIIVIIIIILLFWQAYRFIMVTYIGNRANLECSPPQGYSLDGGRLTLSNVGNLPAHEIKVVWKITKIESQKQPGINYLGSVEYKELPPDETRDISYSSQFKDDEQNIFLIVAWKYKSDGIKECILKHKDYYWNTYWNPPAWAMTNRIDYQSQLSVVDNEIIPELKKKLGVVD